MLHKSNFSIEAAVANFSGAMEADTISKNGRSSKSQMSRENLFFYSKKREVSKMKRIFLFVVFSILIITQNNLYSQSVKFTDLYRYTTISNDPEYLGQKFSKDFSSFEYKGGKKGNGIKIVQCYNSSKNERVIFTYSTSDNSCLLTYRYDGSDNMNSLIKQIESFTNKKMIRNESKKICYLEQNNQIWIKCDWSAPDYGYTLMIRCK